MSESDAFEKFHAYRCGWRDSVKSWIKDKKFAESEKEHIRVAYELGFEAQTIARNSALTTYAEQVGHDVQRAILRDGS